MNPETPLAHLTTLAQLRAAVEAYQGCPLKQTALNTVFADGNPNAPFMLIGEAPGAAEDEQGKPFVGRSGQLLDKLLAEVGVSRQTNAYITNTVFWRPPDNRPPTPEETALCRPFLQRHIALVQPKIILLVGATAVKTVLQTKVGLGKLRRQWHMLENPYLSQPILTLPVFHPAYLLRNPPATPDAQADLRFFRDKAIEMGLLKA